MKDSSHGGCVDGGRSATRTEEVAMLGGARMAANMLLDCRHVSLLYIFKSGK